jgi:hypothetical protein
MVNFLKKHSATLNAIVLIMLLGIPFLLYSAAMQGSAIGVKIFLGLMITVMLFVMKKD